jgi:hypothetical protein
MDLKTMEVRLSILRKQLQINKQILAAFMLALTKKINHSLKTQTK